MGAREFIWPVILLRPARWPYFRGSDCMLDYGNALRTKKGVHIIIDGCTSGVSAKLYSESYCTCRCVLKLQPSDQDKKHPSGFNHLHYSITFLYKSTHPYLLTFKCKHFSGHNIILEVVGHIQNLIRHSVWPDEQLIMVTMCRTRCYTKQGILSSGWQAVWIGSAIGLSNSKPWSLSHYKTGLELW